MKPIIFSTPMVQAIQNNLKTQTRRAIKPQPACHGKSLAKPCSGAGTIIYDEAANVLYCGECGNLIEHSPEGKDYVKQHKLRYQVGDILYVRETWLHGGITKYYYKADVGDEGLKWFKEYGYRWKSPIHMPKEAARTFITVTDSKVERIQDISVEDCIAEGFAGVPCNHPHGRYACEDCMNSGWLEPPQVDFMYLWNSINGTGAWERNDWVAAYTFERCEKPEG